LKIDERGLLEILEPNEIKFRDTKPISMKDMPFLKHNIKANGQSQR
jgi:hypothetical protein